MQDDSLQRQLRKAQSDLVVSGTGVLAFGLWSVIKAVVYMILSMDETMEEARQSMGEALAGPHSMLIVEIITWVLFAVFLMIPFSLHAFVGLSAISEGRGRKRRRWYPVLAGLMVFVLCCGIVLTFASLVKGVHSSTGDPLLITAIVDITSIIALLEVIRSARVSRRLSRKLAG